MPKGFQNKRYLNVSNTPQNYEMLPKREVFEKSVPKTAQNDGRLSKQRVFEKKSRKLYKMTGGCQNKSSLKKMS